jgi:microcystin-dependent protein
MDVYLGTILTFGFNFPPYGWAQCQGQLVPVSQNQALFALLGTTYGGNGQTTFGLPDLQGRTQIGFGQGAGLSYRTLGEISGTEQVTLLTSNMPIHTHAAVFQGTGGGGGGSAVTVKALSTIPTSGATTAPGNNNNILCASPTIGNGQATIWAPSGSTPDIALGGVSGGGGGGITGGTVTNATTGGSLPTPIMNPFLALNFCIALQGIYPTRS